MRKIRKLRLDFDKKIIILCIKILINPKTMNAIIFHLSRNSKSFFFWTTGLISISWVSIKNCELTLEYSVENRSFDPCLTILTVQWFQLHLKLWINCQFKLILFCKCKLHFIRENFYRPIHSFGGVYFLELMNCALWTKNLKKVQKSVLFNDSARLSNSYLSVVTGLISAIIVFVKWLTIAEVDSF